MAPRRHRWLEFWLWWGRGTGSLCELFGHMPDKRLKIANGVTFATGGHHLRTAESYWTKLTSNTQGYVRSVAIEFENVSPSGSQMVSAGVNRFQAVSRTADGTRRSPVGTLNMCSSATTAKPCLGALPRVLPPSPLAMGTPWEHMGSHTVGICTHSYVFQRSRRRQLDYRIRVTPSFPLSSDPPKKHNDPKTTQNTPFHVHFNAQQPI